MLETTHVWDWSRATLCLHHSSSTVPNMVGKGIEHCVSAAWVFLVTCRNVSSLWALKNAAFVPE